MVWSFNSHVPSFSSGGPHQHETWTYPLLSLTTFNEKLIYAKKSPELILVYPTLFPDLLLLYLVCILECTVDILTSEDRRIKDRGLGSASMFVFTFLLLLTVVLDVLTFESILQLSRLSCLLLLVELVGYLTSFVNCSDGQYARFLWELMVCEWLSMLSGCHFSGKTEMGDLSSIFQLYLFEIISLVTGYLFYIKIEMFDLKFCAMGLPLVFSSWVEKCQRKTRTFFQW